MTQTTGVRTTTSLHSLRKALEQAERQFVRLDRTNITTFLVGLDQIEAMFADYGEDRSAVRAEMSRWGKVYTNALTPNLKWWSLLRPTPAAYPSYARKMHRRLAPGGIWMLWWRKAAPSC